MEKQKVEKIKLVRLKESLILGGFGKKSHTALLNGLLIIL